jgi:hypothetical protein
MMKKSNDLYYVVNTFRDPESSQEVIVTAGERFVLRLYAALQETSLDELRFSVYTKAIAKFALSSQFALASLPPMSPAARQHSFRVYLQVQKWLGFSHEANFFGWKLINGYLITVTTTAEPVP